MQDLAIYGSGAKADLSTLGRMREHKQQDYKPDVHQGNMQVKCFFKGREI